MSRFAALACLVVPVAIAIACSTPAAAPPADDAGSGSSSGGGSDGTSTQPGTSSGSADVDAAPDGDPVFVDAGPPAVDFVGRFDRRDPARPICAWPGCRILARFEGTAVSVTLDERALAWMDGVPSEWDASVDRAAPVKIVTKPGVSSYPIATGLPPGPHEVELYKRSEAQNGYTQFRGFDFGGGKLLSPPLKSVRHVEVVADSSAAGFGIEGVGYPDEDCPGLDYSARWQNFHRAFPALLERSLRAEVHGTVYSGKGLVKNVWRPDEATMPLLFPRANPVDDTSVWDFSWQADVVIVMIGGNDFAIGQPDESTAARKPATPAQFTAAYRTFVATLRAKYPQAHLVLSASPSASDAQPAGRSTRTNILAAITTVTAERAAAGDVKVHGFHPAVATPAELTACNGHGTPAFHARVAEELTTFVKQKTGW
jgi:hypothetical protein